MALFRADGLPGESRCTMIKDVAYCFICVKTIQSGK